MDVLQLLHHDLLILNLLRMAPLLPQLIGAIGLMPRLQVAQQLEQRPHSLRFQSVDDLPGGKRFEVGDLLGNIGRGCD